ncbi:hypothetical protein CRYUN_Cryun12cG0070900 [Craigia yunnanensis]
MPDEETASPTVSAPAIPGKPDRYMIRGDNSTGDLLFGLFGGSGQWRSRFRIVGGIPELGAEFVGTFILIFAAAAGPIVNQKYSGAETLIGNAACSGLAVMIIILSTGHISGAHLNPSVTIAFAAFVTSHGLRPTSASSMNPVRTLGPAVAAGNYKAFWIYMIAPMLGALVGSGNYTLVKLREEEAEAPRQVRSFRR